MGDAVSVCGNYSCSFVSIGNDSEDTILRCEKITMDTKNVLSSDHLSTEIIPGTLLQLSTSSKHSYQIRVKRTKSETKDSVEIELSIHRGTLKEITRLMKYESNHKLWVTCVESFDCGALCSNINEDGCECLENSQLGKPCETRSKDCTCRRACKKRSTSTPWHSTFYDACGSHQKLIRCKGYMDEVTCGDLQMGALSEGLPLFDEKGSAKKGDTEKNLPLHCQSCRSTNILSVVTKFKNSSTGSSHFMKPFAKSLSEMITMDLHLVDRFEVEYRLAGSLTSSYHTIIIPSVNISILKEFLDPEFSSNGIRRTYPYSHCNVLNGYGGRMCTKCMQGYARSGFGRGCIECAPVWAVWLQVIGLLLCAVLIMITFIFVILKGAGSDKKTGAVQKIMLNFLQMLGIIGSMPLKWPRVLKEYMISGGSFTMAGESIFPIDCLLKNEVSAVLIKQVMLSLFPIVAISMNALYWISRKWWRKYRHKKQGIAKLHHMEVPKIIALRHQERMKGLHAEIKSGYALQKIRGKRTDMATLALKQIGHAHLQEVQRLTLAVRSGQQTNSAHHHLGRHGLTLDEQATATLHAREFMEYCHEKHVDLHALWREYDNDGSGDITTAQFEIICRKFGFTWSRDEFNHLLMLFDGANADGYIDLATLIQFSRNFWEKFTLTSVTICILLYPTLVTSFFKIVACESNFFDGEHKDDYYLLTDLNIKCFHGLHFVYLCGVGIPMGLLYVIGIPLSMLLLMRHAKNHADSQHHDSVQFRFGILMAGYRESHYTWEIVVTIRKAIMSLI